MQLIVLPEEVQYTMQMSDKLNFEWDFMGISSFVSWIYDLLLGKTYEAKITGSIEGRIDLTGVEAGIVKNKPPVSKLGDVFEEITVNVPIPAGYFIANFGLMNINEIRNKAGFATDKYTIPQIQSAFAEQYPRIVREFIENRNMIANTKETIKRSIEGFINGFMAALDLKDKPPFKKYKIDKQVKSKKKTPRFDSRGHVSFQTTEYQSTHQPSHC